jgi:DNA-binding XRE family transcriptional regulator
MSKMYVAVAESFRRWKKEPGFRRAYDALAEEFALAAALIDARAQAGQSQETVAERMRTSRQTISRLEGGTANPSLRTLRRFAQATGTQLKISFEPAKKKAR